MNPIILSLVISRLRQIANTPNITLVPFDANESSKIREDILTIANSIEKDDPQLSAQIIRAKEILFNSNTFGQAILNPFALGEIIFGLNYIEAKQYKKVNTPDSDNNIWSFIHPLIKKSSKQLFENEHYANAAEDAFIEFGSRAKKIYKKLVPNCKSVPDGKDLMHKLFSGNPLLCEVCDTSTENGKNYQEGFHFLSAGAMSALRNPKAHSNDEVLTAEEAMRRLMFASMLMYKLDEVAI